MSTLTIEVVVPEEVPEVVEPEEPKEGFLGGLENGWNAFLEFGSGALLVLGALLPWLVFVALLALIALWLRRAWLKVRPERAERPARGPQTSMPPTAAQVLWQTAPPAAPPAAPAPVQVPTPAPAPATPPGPPESSGNPSA